MTHVTAAVLVSEATDAGVLPVEFSVRAEGVKNRASSGVDVETAVLIRLRGLPFEVRSVSPPSRPVASRGNHRLGLHKMPAMMRASPTNTPTPCL